MSTETTPDLFRRAADAWVGGTPSDDHTRNELRAQADRLEREQRPLPTKAGWHERVVVERGGEKCTGAMLHDYGEWETPIRVGGVYGHSVVPGTFSTVRWAEQDGNTPGQTAQSACFSDRERLPLNAENQYVRDQCARIVNAVLAAYAAPTLTPVGEHPEPGTRGLLPLVSTGVEWRTYADIDPPTYICGVRARMASVMLADPRPDGAT